MFISNLMMMLGVLINVAFITLLERKILGYSQLRLGPNKPGIIGILQPFSDAIKLFSNKLLLVMTMNFLSKMMPVVGLSLVLISWCIYPTFFMGFSVSYSVITLLMLLSLSVYPVLLMGWGSSSKYSQIGGIRNIAQTISYEVSLALIFLIVLLLESMISFHELIYLNLFCYLVIPMLLVVWILSTLSETNRTPFDFAEGESELVSGFNVEYSSIYFALIFMAEYASIYFFCSLTISLFFNMSLLTVFGVGLFLFFWIWARATFPRYRYDLLMDLNWKLILPLVLVFLFWVSVLNIYNQIQ